jgi:hypothetical protein
LTELPEPGKQLDEEAFAKFVTATAREIASRLGLDKPDERIGRSRIARRQVLLCLRPGESRTD